jgi:hypothetical protein
MPDGRGPLACSEPPEIRLLSLTQPWATLVALGLKRIETRSWGTSYRGLVAIHAAKGYPASARAFANQLAVERLLPRAPARLLCTANLPLGAILALEHLSTIYDTEQAEAIGRVDEQERRFGDYTPGRKAWLLDPERHRPLTTPFPYRGAQGLRALPPDIAARLLEAL